MIGTLECWMRRIVLDCEERWYDMSTYGCKGLRDGKKIGQNDELEKGMGGEMWAIKTEKSVCGGNQQLE